MGQKIDLDSLIKNALPSVDIIDCIPTGLRDFSRKRSTPWAGRAKPYEYLACGINFVVIFVVILIFIVLFVCSSSLSLSWQEKNGS